MTEITEKPPIHSNMWALDDLLKEIGGFGRYQIFIFTLFALPIMLSGAYSVSFVFTAGDLNYRCRIPECEDSNTSIYNSSWVEDAIPFKNKLPEKCLRYEYLNSSSDSCSADSFNTQRTIECDDFIFETEEKTLQNRVRFLSQ